MGKITQLAQQQRNADRINVYIDGTYCFSLDAFQVSELGVRVGRNYTDAELTNLRAESAFGKLYVQALDYVLLRPHSVKEIRDYLWKKTQTRYIRARDGTVHLREGVDPSVAHRVLARLSEKQYIDDTKFSEYWVENRRQRQGISVRKLRAELAAKGVKKEIIDVALQNTTRDEKSELAKVIAKKSAKYPDEQKLIAYLVRQGFAYDAIKESLDNLSSQD